MNTEHYFYRNIIFSKQGKQVALIDLNNPSHIEPLDEWFGMVVLLADGQHKIEEFLTLLTNHYKGYPPANLKQTIESVFKRLIESKFIILTEEKTQLPYYMSMPYEQLDLDKAKKMYAEDRAKVN